MFDNYLVLQCLMSLKKLFCFVSQILLKLKEAGSSNQEEIYQNSDIGSPRKNTFIVSGLQLNNTIISLVSADFVF